MIGIRRSFSTFVLVPGIITCLSQVLVEGQPYDLPKVAGIEAFGGSAKAKEILARNGFVVADPAFKQIFEAYIESPQIEEPSSKNPRGKTLPSFITTDSAWDTYHVLLEEGVKDLEEIQRKRLLKFSRQLRMVAMSLGRSIGPLANDAAQFASVGLALEDELYRKSADAETKRIVDGLRTGSVPVKVPVGFDLAPAQFRAQSFYAQSPGLGDYYAARQWYASVVFRLSNQRETKLAVVLATLVKNNPELLNLWRQLTDPYNALLALPEDGSVSGYAEAAHVVLGKTKLDVEGVEQRAIEIQKRLEERLPVPRVNDQLLSPAEYAHFSQVTRGFRLLPPRRLPSAVCFQNTTEPKIPGRMYPSGLDFLAASPVLRSPAALRVAEHEFGERVSGLVLKADCGPMPDSLYGDALRLLRKLQEPLPLEVAPALRTRAWAEKQLWTQLGAWAQQRHTWALHSKLSVMYMGSINPPAGMVAPYPDFFSGLAKLTRQTAKAFQKAGLEQEFDVKTVAGELLDLLNLREKLSKARDEKELEKNSGKLEQLGHFQERYYEKHRSELEQNGSRNGYRQMQANLMALARRCAASGQADEADTETLRSFYDCRQSIVRLLNNFAPVCDRLAGLARKSLMSKPLTKEDGDWIKNYGVTLAGFHFYYGNSYEVPRDDFPIVTRVFANPLTDSMLYAGLARPQALYIIIPTGSTLQLYRGAVMSYREFIRPADQLLDDESWRQLVSDGKTPPAPPFTTAFLAERTAADWMQALRHLKFDAGYDEVQDILWQLGYQATEKELPELIQMMIGVATSPNAHQTEVYLRDEGNGTALTHWYEATATWVPDVTRGLAEIISHLPWENYQGQLILLLASTNSEIAEAAAHVLAQNPARINVDELVGRFTFQPVRARRFCCALLGRLPHQSDATRKLLLRALHDPADGVRWQAVLAISKADWNDAQSTSALLDTLNDTNEFVAAAAVHALAQLGASNATPELFVKLKACLQQPVTVSNGPSPRAAAILRDIHGEEGWGERILDAPELTVQMELGVPAGVRLRASTRLPPTALDFPTHNYNLADALIEALGDLGYTPGTDELFALRKTDYDREATRALNKLAPVRLEKELLDTARDKQIDSYAREQALVALCRISTTNCVRDLIPLLNDTTPIVYSRPQRGPEWRICDRAALTIGLLMGWQDRLRMSYLRPEDRAKLMARAKEWAKSQP